jgi:hypothetical protein
MNKVTLSGQAVNCPGKEAEMIRELKKAGKVIFIAVAAFVLAFSGGSKAYALYDDVELLPEKAEWMPEVGADITFMTKYVWRGQLLDEEPVMQFDTYLSKWGLTLDVWGNYSLNSDKDSNFGRYQELTELDYTISYDMNIGDMSEKLGIDSPDIIDPLSFSAGYIFYTFPNLDFDEKGSYTHEVFLGASYDCLLQPYFTWYWDVEAARGSYLEFGGGHTFELGGGVEASLGMSFAYNYEQWTDESGWSDMLLSCEVAIPVFNNFTVTPSVYYSVILDEDTYNGAQENEFYGGISLSFSY